MTDCDLVLCCDTCAVVFKSLGGREWTDRWRREGMLVRRQDGAGSVGEAEKTVSTMLKSSRNTIEAVW